MTRWSFVAMATLIAAAPTALAETTVTTSPSASIGRVHVTTDDATGVTIIAPAPRAVVTGVTQTAPFVALPQAAAPSATATANVAVNPSTGLGVVSVAPDGTTGAGTAGATPVGAADFEGNGIADNRAVAIRNRNLAFGPLGSTLSPGTASVGIPR